MENNRLRLNRNRRENPKVTDSIEAKIVRYKQAKTRAMRMAPLAEHPSWPDVRAALQEKIDLVDAQLLTFLDYSDRERDCMLQQKVDFQAMISMVEDVDSNLGKFDAIIGQLEEQLEQRKAGSRSSL